MRISRRSWWIREEWYEQEISAHIINILIFVPYTAWGFWFAANQLPVTTGLVGVLLLLAIPITGISMLVNNLIQQFTVDEEGLRERSFAWKTAPMKWSEIKSITVGFDTKLANFLLTPIFYPVTISSVKGKAVRDSLFGSSCEITITRGIKNRKELLRIIVDKCKDNPDIEISEKFLELR